MAQTVYTLAILYSLTVGVALALHGGFRFIDDRTDVDGAMEVLTGGVIVFGLAVLQFDGLVSFLPSALGRMDLLGKVLSAVSVVGALVSVDYLLNRLWPVLTRATDRGPVQNLSQSRRTVVGVTLGVAAASVLGGTSYLHSRTPLDAASDTQSAAPDTQPGTSSGDGPSGSSGFSLQAAYDAPGPPTAAAFDDQGRGYVTTLKGKIFSFDRPTGPEDPLQFEEVASGLRFPQGIEVLGDTVYAVDPGEAGQLRAGQSGIIENLRNSNGSVVAFDVDSDGSLGDRRTVLSELPVVNRAHSPNGITAGPDGRLYLSIGHLGNPHPKFMEDGRYRPPSDLHPNIEYLGTVISFAPDGSDVQVVARGLRNVYDISFDADGNLFGADNDGATARSKQWDTLYSIVEGGYYGYPEYGTFDGGAFSEKTRDPLWVFDTFPVGIEAGDSVVDGRGALVGTTGEVVFVPLREDEHGFFVPESPSSVVEMDGVNTVVEASPEGQLYVGSLGQNKLAVFQVDD